jgi:hypothetical protein
LDWRISAMRAVFAANVVVAGVVGGLSLFAPHIASRTVFSGTAEASVPMRIVGAFWLAIALLSIAGFLRPLPFVGVLVVQLAYKATWLAVVATPSLLAGSAGSLPGGVVLFFLAWVLVLPFVIPWSHLGGGS